MYLIIFGLISGTYNFPSKELSTLKRGDLFYFEAHRFTPDKPGPKLGNATYSISAVVFDDEAQQLVLSLHGT